MWVELTSCDILNPPVPVLKAGHPSSAICVVPPVDVAWMDW